MLKKASKAASKMPLEEEGDGGSPVPAQRQQ